MRTVTSVLLLAAVIVTCQAPADAQVVLSNEYKNLDADRALTNVPVTLSRIGVNGDFTKGITPVVNGTKLPAQVNVLRHAEDGSIRHALVSLVLPSVPAGGTVKVDWLNEKPAADVPFKDAVKPEDLKLKLVLLAGGGKKLVADASAALGNRGLCAKVVTYCAFISSRPYCSCKDP
jgi:hypothetical protein